MGWNATNLLNFLKKLFKSIVPRLSVDDTGKPVLDINFVNSQTDQMLSEVMKIPEKLAETGKKVCVAFDEFQEISKLNGDILLKELRSYIQLQTNVSYIFSGSKTHIMKEIFANKNNPFYNIGKIKYIDKISSSELMSFLQNRSAQAGRVMPRKIAEEICRKCQSVPYYTQMLAYEIFNLAIRDNTYSEDFVDKAIELLLNSKSEEYLIVWDNLGLSQKKTIEILVKNEGENLYNSKILAEYTIASSTLYKAITQLKHKNIIYPEKGKLLFTDIFFKEWLIKKII